MTGTSDVDGASVQISHSFETYESKLENGRVVALQIREMIKTTQCITNQLHVITFSLFFLKYEDSEAIQLPFLKDNVTIHTQSLFCRSHDHLETTT
jgi:hypothetical protein